jgi:hypothetical protein
VVEAAFGFGPLSTPTGADWVPLLRTDTGKTRAMSASWEFGRDDDLDPFPGGHASLLLWNRDRYLDPNYSSSPYNGDLLPRVPVRIRSQNVATLAYTDEFYGFVQNGWEQVLTPVGMTGCRIELGDLLSVLEGYELPDVFEHPLLAAGPVGLWMLDGPGGSEAVADRSGNGHDGTVYSMVTFGERGVGSGPSSARFQSLALTESDSAENMDSFGRIQISRSRLVDTTANAAMVATFRTTVAPTGAGRPIFIQGNGNGNTPGNHVLQLRIGPDGLVHSLAWDIGASFYDDQWPTTVNNGQDHIVFTQSDGIAVDTATLLVNDSSLGWADVNGVGIGGYFGWSPKGGYDGWIGAVAIYDTQLTLPEREAILAGYQRLSGLRSDEHISWALDRIGVPAGLRDLDTGSTFLGPANTRGRDALSWIREVVQTEGGEFYVDHRNGGVLRFRHRYARNLEASGTTSQATFSDDPGAASVIRYSADGLDIAPNGLDSIVNQIKVTWASGELTVDDSASIAAYGPRPRTLQTVATTASQARSAGEWIVSRRKDPASRVRGCIAAKTAIHSIDDRAHDLEVGHRVTFRYYPTGLAKIPIGTATTSTLHVEGMRHVVERMTWQTTFRFSSAPTFVPWIWGTGAWGTTAYWG